MPQELCNSVRSSAGQEGLRRGAGNPRGCIIKNVSLIIGENLEILKREERSPLGVFH